MKTKRFYFAIMSLCMLTMLMYPRLLPASAPALLRAEDTVDFVYGFLITIDIAAAWFLVRDRNRVCPG